METKVCTKCGRELPSTPEYFHRSKIGINGIRPDCKECSTKRSRDWQENNKERAAKKIKEWYIKNKYNLSLEEVQGLFDRQSGLCNICYEPFIKSSGKVSYHIDHCHTTGKVRGLLCGKCNMALGLLREDIQIFKSAISYLELHNG